MTAHFAPTPIQRCQAWLGTLVEVTLWPQQGASEACTQTALTQAFAASQRVHEAMSPMLPNSDISRFNQASDGTRLTLDPWTVQVLKAAAQLATLTDGGFDVSLGSAPPHQVPYTCLSATEVIKHGSATQLDLGGIAKGYAVDRMVATLRAYGVRSGCVNAGGDLRCFGEHTWPVWKRLVSASPNDAHTAPLSPWLSLQHGSLASSQYRNGVSPLQGDALFAPQGTQASSQHCYVAVAAPRCIWADALTKIVAQTGRTDHPALNACGAQAWFERL